MSIRRDEPRPFWRTCMWGLLLGAGLNIAHPGTAHARADVEVEFVPTVAIPLTNYLVTEGSTISQIVESQIGFGTELNLLLNDFEFRYSLSYLPSGNMHIEVSEDFAANFNESAVIINQTLGAEVFPTMQPGAFDLQGDPISIHHINFGYRIHLYREAIDVYLPLGVGMAFTTGPSSMLSRTLFGLGANTGLGVGYKLRDWLQVGGAVRYLATITESAGDITIFNALANFGVTQEDIASTFHVGHVVHIGATASVRF